MKDDRIIELDWREVLKILVDHFGIEYKQPEPFAKDQDTKIAAQIYWEGNTREDKRWIRKEK